LFVGSRLPRKKKESEEEGLQIRFLGREKKKKKEAQTHFLKLEPPVARAMTASKSQSVKITGPPTFPFCQFAIEFPGNMEGQRRDRETALHAAPHPTVWRA
jgi:hypothetical protein